MRHLEDALWLLALLPMGCGNDDFHQCEGGTSDIVCSLQASAEPRVSSATGVTYVVTITASVPKLEGGAQVLVSTSIGTVADAAPGKEATVFLPALPNAPRGSGMLAGKVTWHVPPMDTAELTIRMEEATATLDETTP
jgi:hypothetical protein